jgi:hypothetical protein
VITGVTAEQLDGNVMRVVAFVSRIRGRNPINPTAVIPPQGGPGSFFNSVITANSPIFWDELHVLGDNGGSNNFDDFEKDEFGLTFWGLDDLGISGSPSNRVIYELPRLPMVSLGQFKNVRASHPASMITLGNSWPSPEIALTDVQNLIATDSRADLFDDNWLNNDALFDGFFFSTVPPNNRASNTTYPVAWGNSTTDFTKSNIENGDPLLNPRLKYVKQADGNAPGLGDLQDMDKAAANLMLDGGFNINSTSVAAWRAVLASLRFPTNPGAPVSRFVQSITSNSTSADIVTENIEIGRRVLTDTQVDDLAVAIVEQVKLRGPFLTLSDFVNRRRVNSELGRKGVLQAAIDASGINDAALSALGGRNVNLSGKPPENYFYADRKSNVQNLANAENPPGGTGNFNTAMGAAGMITQADLLQYLAPILTARSDTFAIRVYGEAGRTLPGGVYREEGKTYGEAIVQRVPEFVDQTDAALTANNATLGKVAGNATPLDAVNAVNQKLGRRFKVVSFRWLNPEEI